MSDLAENDRKVEEFVDGQWVSVSMLDLTVGSIFRLFESDGTRVIDPTTGADVWKSVGEPYTKNNVYTVSSVAYDLDNSKIIHGGLCLDDDIENNFVAQTELWIFSTEDNLAQNKIQRAEFTKEIEFATEEINLAKKKIERLTGRISAFEYNRSMLEVIYDKTTVILKETRLNLERFKRGTK